MATSSLANAAERLFAAQEQGRPCAPVSDLLGYDDISAAYEVQQLIAAKRIARGARLVGRKIGLTSQAVQKQIGVDRPDFGVLLDEMQFHDGETIPFSLLLQPRAEAELAFILAQDITEIGGRDQLLAAISYAVPAIEIVDSRIENWKIGITDTIADNASSGVYVLGRQQIEPDAIDFADVSMVMRRNGEIVSEGTGRDCLGDPLNAVEWLARTAIEFGAPLKGGDVILSGALGPMVPVQPGDVFEALIEPLGSVSTSFSNEGEK